MAKSIGRLRPFCHNPRAMQETVQQWKYFRAQMLHYLRLVPLGLVIACVPLLFNWTTWRQAGTLSTGVSISVIYGLVIPLAIWVSYGAFYGTRIWLGARLGVPLRYSRITYALINVVGLCLGLWLALIIIRQLYGWQATLGNLLFSLFFGGLAMIFFTTQYAYRRAKEEALALRATLAEAKYHALESQMQPHFLFNALNSLAELIESGQAGAAETTFKLAELYRKILANSATKTASLSSELEIVRAYLEIEQLRFGERLQYELKVDAALGEIYLPSLILQTLVENAIKHGVAPALTGGSLSVELARATDGLYLAQIRNTGQALPGTTSDGTGLQNTRARLALLYGERHQFKLERTQNGQTVASFYFSGERLD